MLCLEKANLLTENRLVAGWAGAGVGLTANEHQAPFWPCVEHWIGRWLYNSTNVLKINELQYT